jgi:phosphoribosylpyrophosphate synthetase
MFPGAAIRARSEDVGDVVIAAPDLGASKYPRRIRKAIIDTGGSILSVAQRLQDEGARDVELRCTHGLFNGDVTKRFRGVGSVS